MISQKLIPVQGVYSLEKWTKPNPLIITDLLPADISSVELGFFSKFIHHFIAKTESKSTEVK